MRNVDLDDKTLTIRFNHRDKGRFYQMVNAVKQVDGARFVNDREDRRWEAPAGAHQCQQILAVLEPLNFKLDPKVRELAVSGKRLSNFTKRRGRAGKYHPDLYPFQVVGVDFAKATGYRGLLGDEMGLGKTVQILVAVNELQPDGVMVTCPANVTYKWVREVERWTDLSASVVDGYKGEIEDTDVHVCSYNVFNERVDEFIDQYEMWIPDEFHYLKGREDKVQRVRSAVKFSHGIPYIFGLSGTPFLNRPVELYNMLHILDPIIWDNFWRYGHRYCGAKKTYWGTDFTGSSNTEELASRLQEYMLRRLKMEVLDDLPELQRTYLPVDIKNMREYRLLHKEVTKELSGANALTELNKLRYVVGMGKAAVAIGWAKNFLDQGDTHKKLVIYAHHHDVVNRLIEGLEGYGVVSITGKTPQKQRDVAVQAFQEGAPRVIVITSAGGEGIDLFGTGQVDASTLLFAEREWSPMSEEQVEGRLHRMGQANPVDAYYLVANGTVDEDIARLVDTKRAVIRDVVRLHEASEVEDASIIADLVRELKGE